MKISLALSSQALTAFARLPKLQQKKFSALLNQFRSNPKASGINFERIQGACSPAARSLRIDGTYRAIVLHPNQGNQYLVVWMDHHDRAYEWARRKKVAIHPDTGAIQVYEAIDSTQTQEAPRGAERVPGQFDGLRDRQLRRLGVPDELIPLVRNIHTEEELQNSEPKLPRDAFEALYFISEDVPYEEVLRSIPGEDEPVATGDFEKALSRTNSRRQFVVVPDDSILEEMLDATLEQWRVFLHPSQRRLVDMNANGPVRVLGGAGTGKTVVAMHRAKRLVEEVFIDKTDRILFTTFTRNLAGDIEANLKSIIAKPAHMQRVEVVNFDSWVAKLMRQMGVQYRVAYAGRDRSVIDEAWDSALEDAPNGLGFTEEFYHEEFHHVILANGITSEREYYQVARTGRGRPIRRVVRKQIWPVFSRFRSFLSTRGLRMPEDAYRDLRTLLSARSRTLPYRAVIVDEAQDMSAEAMRLIRQITPEQSPNDLFIVGDAHQRIYGQPIVLGRCGIDIRGRGRWLHINYRTPEEIRNWAVGLLHGIPIDDLDGERDVITLKQFTSLIRGTVPEIKSFDSFGDECQAIAEYIHALVPPDQWQRICLVARTNQQRALYQGALNSKGLKTHSISRDRQDSSTTQGIRLATMHRVKGLEFDHVIAAGVNHDKLPLSASLDRLDDTGLRKSTIVKERSLMYVTATRAKKSLLITSHGKPSPFIQAELTNYA